MDKVVSEKSVDFDLLLQLAVIFVITQALGLFVAGLFLQNGLKATLINENPEDIANSLGLIVWIILFSGILLLLMKFLKEKFLYIVLKIIESLAVFGTSYLIVSVFLFTFAGMGAEADVIGIAFGVLLVASRIFFAKNVLLRNISSVFATAGAGALIGVSLGVWPVIVLLILLSAYDFIAVFKTKHMVSLAKGVTSKNLSFTYALPTPKHQFELGTGDLVMPLVFASSVLAHSQLTAPFPNYFIPSVVVLLASYIGLVITLDYVSRRPGTALPALPPQTALMLFAFALLKLVGF
jgi:presenilin-like A22 family membrane protease